jgi:hypothetical protein
MSQLEKAIIAAAKAGEIDTLLELVAEKYSEDDEDATEAIVRTFQWLTIAQDFGSEEAGEYADGLLEAELNRYGDETIALAYYEVGRWYLLGESSLPQNSDKGFEHLRYAQDDLQVRDQIDLEEDIEEVRARLSGERLEQFAEIFPPLLVET